MADDSRSRGFAAKEQKLQAKLDNLQSRYGKAKELLENPGVWTNNVWRELTGFCQKLMR
jgi:hypothetical protein